MKRLFEWLILSLIGLGALTLAAPHVPATARKLVLFPIAVALAAAAVMAGLARFSALPLRRPVLLLAALLILGSEIGGTVLHWRLQVASLPPIDRDAEAAAARAMIEQATPDDDPAARERYEKLLAEMGASEEESLERRRAEREFGSYLGNRVAPLGRWQSPWPAVFWAGELLLATALGTLMFRQTASAGTAPAPSGPA